MRAASAALKDSAADAFRVRPVSARRPVRRLGEGADADMGRIAEGSRAVFDL